jgi:type IV pilus assembly protein PilN
MTKINLLPWREQRLKKKQTDFITSIILSALAGLIIIGLLHSYIEGLISYQEQRNQILLNEIASLDKKIVAIKSIEEKKKKLLAKIDLIQKLQESRPEIVHLFDEIPKSTPDGVYLTKFTQTGTELIFEGKSQSNARVSAFMRAIEASPWLKKPGLTVIHSPEKPSADKNDTDQLSDFMLRAMQENQNTNADNGVVNELIRH